jgi:hypothetical protein
MKKQEKEIREAKFIGVDEWNRPIFKVINVEKQYFLSDVENLFDLGTKEEEILKFYAQYEKEGN